MMRDPLELISAYFDDSLADGEFAQLRDWIRSDPQHMRRFVRESMLHSRLRDLLHEREVCSLFAAGDDEQWIDPNHIVSLLEEEEAVAERRAREYEEAARRAAEAEARRRELELDRTALRVEEHSIPARWYLAAAAAACLLVVLGWQVMTGPGEAAPGRIVHRPAETAGPVYVGAVTKTLDGLWNREVGADEAVRIGTRLTAGPLHLTAGIVELQLTSGARLVVEAPASLQIISADRVQFNHGKLVANVPPQAVGFTLRSKAASFVDLGTEFGVEVAETGVASVHVIDGEVALVRGDAALAEPSRTLQVGQANQVSADGSSVEEIPFEATRFLRHVPATPYELAVLKSRPLAYWRLDDCEPQQTFPSEGKLSLATTPNLKIESTKNPGRSGPISGPPRAAAFDGEHDGIDIMVDAALARVSDVTCEAWVWPGQGPTGPWRIFSTFDRPRSGLAIGIVDGQWYNLPDDELKFQLTVYGVYDCISATPVRADEWIHLVATVADDGSPALYVNGEPVARQFRHIEEVGDGSPRAEIWRPEGVTPVGTTPSGFARIGRNPLGSDNAISPERWYGLISNVAVYDRVLSAEEIQRHFEATRRSNDGRPQATVPE
jgi:hypothetical protein